MKLADITVAIPTKNEQHNIAAFLKSLPENIKLIVVDASTDETRDVIHKLRPQNTTIIEKDCTIPVARQTAVDVVKSPWIIFSDGDVYFKNNYFKLLQELEPKDAFFGMRLSEHKYVKEYNNLGEWQKRFYSVGIPGFCGSNMGARVEVIKAVGGFDKDLVINEDTELGFRIQKQGYDIQFYENLLVYAYDYRRIKRSIPVHMLRSFTRNFLLYYNLMPTEWKRDDWGYWS